MMNVNRFQALPIALCGALVLVLAMGYQILEMQRMHQSILELSAQLTSHDISKNESGGELLNSIQPGSQDDAMKIMARIDALNEEVSSLRVKLDQAIQSDGRTHMLSREVVGAKKKEQDVSDPLELLLQELGAGNLSSEDAAKWVAGLPPGEEQDKAALAVINYWLESDPSSAAHWAANFGEGNLRDQALRAVSRRWGLEDWNQTSAWLATLPDGEFKDSAIGSFVTSADGKDIALAIEWANQTGNQDDRTKRVQSVAKRWLLEDEAAATKWLQAADLPVSLKQELLGKR
ncbi:hypothetical protein JIN85_01840 [Luteolibacter pohnpeiensis]|uniref:Uncharacterized protein n=1 Tax=Luteolibacter pohnpeiensis TaxID=454153 RepID=A0A934VV34_9BACT|nr:hypothetical protein [Luteolibacter pohnpeiensis]MBK1881134.1 hypothetical protein [Luteolibacter pohnpeiensis]